MIMEDCNLINGSVQENPLISGDATKDFQGAGEAADKVEDHGTPLDNEKKRVRCNYCGKEVRGFSRLQHHLASLGTDVAACDAVPANIKAQMRNALLDKKKERLLKEVGQLFHPNLPLKRNIFHASAEQRNCQSKPSHPSTPASEHTSRENIAVSACYRKPGQPVVEDKGKQAVGTEQYERSNGSYVDSSMSQNINPVVKEEIKEQSALYAARCIGEFFFEAAVDLNAVKSPSFQKMIEAVIGNGAGCRVPSFDELQGWILQDEVQAARDYVKDMKRYWVERGCSIVLDCWTDQRGRSLIGFLANCDKGTVFLRSIDASSAIHDVDALFLLLSSVVEEVGVENVVQVISHDASCYMEAASKKLIEKHRTIFWTLCSDFCINLIFERIEVLDHVKHVLLQAKTITRFIYSHVLPLGLVKKLTGGRELVKTSRLKSVTPFLTLENMLSERENLVQVFTSPSWTESVWACKAKGKAVADLVTDPLFWAAVGDVLKAATPLLRVLHHQIHGDNNAPMGFLYDAMDRAKEMIKENVGGIEANYLPLWGIIDDVWNNYLHSPLHSAGYYLNPRLFYSNDFFVDAEVTNGLLCCTVRMVEDRRSQDLIVVQLDAYRTPMGGFSVGIAVDQRDKLSPALWWSLFGSQSPELQRLAVRILSQTCNGASRYKLRRSLSEQVHAKGRNCIEQQRFCDLEFVHNNLLLRRLPPPNGHKDDTPGFEDLNPFNDWIVEGAS